MRRTWGSLSSKTCFLQGEWQGGAPKTTGRCYGDRGHCAGGEGEEGRGRGCMPATKTTRDLVLLGQLSPD